MKEKVKGSPTPELHITSVGSLEDYTAFSEQEQDSNNANWSFENSLIPDDLTDFTLNGVCYVCKLQTDFAVDFLYSHELNGKRVPNWRERLICPSCELNNRLRAVIHIFEQVCEPEKDSDIYLTEQLSPLYAWFREHYSRVIGSEFIGDSVDFGACDEEGVRNEDLTQLSIKDETCDYILSFDILEHIPNYRKAISECARCLKPGGRLLLSVPFANLEKKNIIRAKVSDSGEIEHLLPAEYHGDPLNPDGCLCFYHFGWELLEDLNSLGFENSRALLYWSKKFGYLGGQPMLFVATKSHSKRIS
jgi:SAM-dependent methyltransferase